MKNLFYVALLLGLATTAWGQDLSVATTEVTEVAGEVAMGATFVDVRENPEVTDLAYDLPGTLHIPLSELPGRLGEITPDQPVILACRSGRRSVQAARLLQENGYDEVSSLAGGILAWQAADLPVRKGYASPQKKDSSATMSCGGHQGKGKGKGKGQAASCCGKKSSGATGSCGKESSGSKGGCCGNKNQ
jgi:rhodanese-related sulfurtransferase